MASALDRGFTRIELLIVIIGILAAVVVPTSMNERERAKRAAVRGSVQSLASLGWGSLGLGDADSLTKVP